MIKEKTVTQTVTVTVIVIVIVMMMMHVVDHIGVNKIKNSAPKKIKKASSKQRIKKIDLTHVS
jgi:uncharacterized metal-binding protein